MNKFSLTTLLAILTVGTCVYAKPPKPENQGDKPRMQMRAEAIKAFDKDGDGKLSEEERTAMQEARKGKGEEMRAAALKEFDKDGDGKLSEQERTAMQEARKAKGEEMRAAILKKFDKDGDGKLSEEERTAMQEARKAKGGKHKGKGGAPEGDAPSK